MPASDGTFTVEDVALHLGVPSDPRMQDATDAVHAYVEESGHKWAGLHPDGLWFAADLVHGAVLWAAAEYQARVTPEGMAGYDPSVGGVDTFNLKYRADTFLQLDPGFA